MYTGKRIESSAGLQVNVQKYRSVIRVVWQKTWGPIS